MSKSAVALAGSGDILGGFLGFFGFWVFVFVIFGGLWGDFRFEFFWIFRFFCLDGFWDFCDS